MSIDEFYAAVNQLGLRPSTVPHVYVCLANGEHHNVPDATKYSPEDRGRIIAKLTTLVRGYC